MEPRMNTREAEETAFELVDAIGPDFVGLAPPGEAHLDSVHVAESIAYAILAAAGLGITSGITEWSKAKTKELLGAISTKIGQRLRYGVEESFSTTITVEGHRAALEEAADTLRTARDALQSLDSATIDAVISTVASSVRSCLEEMGLRGIPGERVQGALEEKLANMLEDGRNSQPR